MISRIPSKVLKICRPCKDLWPSWYRVDKCSMPFSRMMLPNMPNRIVSATKGRRSSRVITRIPVITATRAKIRKSRRPLRCMFWRKLITPVINQKRPMELKRIGRVLSVNSNAIPNVISITPRKVVSPVFNALRLDLSGVLSVKLDHWERLYYLLYCYFLGNISHIFHWWKIYCIKTK